MLALPQCEDQLTPSGAKDTSLLGEYRAVAPETKLSEGSSNGSHVKSEHSTATVRVRAIVSS